MSNLLLVLLMAAMPFFYPMWDNESQRIGVKMCTPFGYMLHGIAELLGLVWFLLLLLTSAYLIYEWIAGHFHLSLLWLLTTPYAVAYGGRILDWCSWILAKQKRVSLCMCE